MVVRKLLIGVGVVVTSSSIYFASVSERSVVTDRKRILLYPLWYESWKGAHKYADQKKTTTIVTNHPMSRSLNESFSKIKTVGVSNLLIEEESRFGRRGKNKLKKISENTKGELVIVHNDILEKNAQCFAGGHVIVEERIFQMLSEKESRVVLCHEYAHCILRHHNEKGFIANTCLVLHILILVLHIPIVIKGLIRYDCKMIELEADKVGIMLHRACGWEDQVFVEAVLKICGDEDSDGKT
ncbi:hypothetical protein FRX31_021104 [Thalictrum thalictroides]|uniref:Peptidase M48 domain-containing protein n=1 Tax=Thalictrum thalictroides TaxID=46969 RepID=A0A7J6VW29_THATH|nr:hypothetical protein FRX31_021104 [Thalictrum thalictroides]